MKSYENNVPFKLEPKDAKNNFLTKTIKIYCLLF